VTPYNVSVAMSEDPTTSRRLSWNTHPDAALSVVEVAKQADVESAGGFDSAAVRRYEGASSVYHTNNDGTIRVHKAVADGLEPDTTYVYRVGDGAGHVSASGEFRTAPVDGDRTKFLFFGDSQASDAAGFALWGETLRKGLADAPDAEFLVHAGDIVDHGHEEEQWKLWFDEAQEALMSTTLVGILGNHEVTGENPDAPGDEGKDFTSHFNFPENGIEPLKGSNYSFDYKNIHFAVLNSEYYYEEQRDWLRADLAGAEQPWKIVLFHRGPYGSYYSTEAVKTYWTPVFDEFGVDLVLNGHDHLYMKSYPMKGGVAVEPGEGTVYVIGGSSGPKFYDRVDQPWQEKVYDRNIQIYSTVEVNGGALTFVAKTVDGEEVDRFTLKKPDPVVGIELTGPAELIAGLTAPTVTEAVYASGVRAPLAGGVTFASSDPGVATVDASGVVAAHAAGEATITASYGEWSAALTVRVVPPVMTGIEVVGPNSQMRKGDLFELTVAAVYNNGAREPVFDRVSFRSSEPSVVSVDGKGRLRANKDGVAVITATYGDWSAAVTVAVGTAEPQAVVTEP
jgi:predicted phosphodiesterase